MDSVRKVMVVLPAYNEEESLPLLLDQFKKFISSNDPNLTILIVNDGSIDKTTEVVRNFKHLTIQLIDNSINEGLGKVLKQGLVHALEAGQPGDIIITMDADNSHNPILITEMLEAIDRGAEVVIASRYRKGSKVVGLSTLRRLTSFMAGALFKIFAPIKGVRDYTCGYRAYTYDILKKAYEKYGEALIEEKGFSCMVELLLKLSFFKPRYEEVPMVLRYDLKKGASKMKIWKTIKKTISVLVDYRSEFSGKYKERLK